MELALISFDGLDPRVIYNNREELENFDEFMKDSMHGSWSTPGHTIPSFTATLTGRQHNNCNFHWDDGRGDYQRHRQTGFDYLWDVCDSSMTLLNIPVLYPPEDIDDVMVCGFLTPDGLTDTNLAKPQEVQKMLNEYGYIHDVDAGATYEKLGGEGMLDLMKTMMDTKARAAEQLIEDYDSDLFYGVFTATDRWFHQCAMYGEDHMPLYRKTDQIFGRMLEAVPDDIPVIAFSDHGFAHFPSDEGVHKGHMYKGWYSIRKESLPNGRDNSVSIFDLYPTVVNYLEGELDEITKGKVLFNTESQDGGIEERLKNLGYME